MTQDNPDKPQPEKAKPKAAAKNKAAPANPGATQDAVPAALAKPRARKAAAPNTAEPKTTKSKTTKPKTAKPTTASDIAASGKTAPKAALPKTSAPKTGAPKTGSPKTGESKTAAATAVAAKASAKSTVSRTAASDPAAKPGSSAETATAVTSTEVPARPKPIEREIPAPAPSQGAVPIASQAQVEPAATTALAAANPLVAERQLSDKPIPGRANSTATKSARQRAVAYWQLMRMHKPIGTLLLLWPTLWALCLAAKGLPRWDLLVIFVSGVFVMRSAGCVINDFADRNIDGQVKRTKDRPLVNGTVSSGEAIGLFILLCLLGFGLVLLTNKLTIQLSVGGLLLAFCYPFMKRYTHLPQVVLGAAFAWSIPMAFAAQSGNLGAEVWLVYTTVVLWTVVYDTFYAMVDRDDDRRIGVKSTAILFGEQDRMITGVLQALTLYGLVMIGSRFELGLFYYLSLVVAAALFVYQQYLIRSRDRDGCFKAFLNNNWVGAAVFAGIAGDFLLSRSL